MSSRKVNVPVIVMYADNSTLKRFGAKGNEIIELADNEKHYSKTEKDYSELAKSMEEVANKY